MTDAKVSERESIWKSQDPKTQTRSGALSFHAP